MTLRTVAATAACIGSLLLASVTVADGLPDEDDFNPVPSTPGVPAPGVVQPPPIKNTPAVTKPAPAPVVKPAPVAAPKPVVTPAPTLGVTPKPAPVAAPTPVPAPTPAPTPAPVAPPPTAVAPTPPVTTPPAAPVTTPAPAPSPVTTPAPVTPPPAAVTTPPAASTPAPAAPSTASLSRLHAVISIDVQLLERQPPLAEVTVKGVAPTGGWTNITLRPVETKSGVLELELVGTPPAGPSTQALTNVAAAVQINPLPAEVKMIRIVSQTNKALKVIR